MGIVVCSVAAAALVRAPRLVRRHRGGVIGIELKSKGGRCSPAQLATRQRMVQAGACLVGMQVLECRDVNPASGGRAIQHDHPL
jgi:hypothetical protein